MHHGRPPQGTLTHAPGCPGDMTAHGSTQAVSWARPGRVNAVPQGLQVAWKSSEATRTLTGWGRRIPRRGSRSPCLRRCRRGCRRRHRFRSGGQSGSPALVRPRRTRRSLTRSTGPRSRPPRDHLDPELNSGRTHPVCALRGEASPHGDRRCQRRASLLAGRAVCGTTAVDDLSYAMQRATTSTSTPAPGMIQGGNTMLSSAEPIATRRLT